MFWWFVLAVIVIGLAVLWFRGRSRSGSSSSFNQDAVIKAHRDRGWHGGSGGGGG